MADHVCPACGLISPARSLQCDCGWRFDRSPVAAAENHRLEGEAASSRSNARGWLVVGVLAILAGCWMSLVSYLGRGSSGLYYVFGGMIALGIRFVVKGLRR